MKCHRYESPNNPQITEDIARSKVLRNAIQLGKYKNQPIAVGGWYTLTGDRMSLDDGSYIWTSIDDFPCFTQDCGGIYWYASVSISNSYIIMGGTTGNGILDGIVEFKDDVWTPIGKLRQPRAQHSAIFNGKEIMIVGGDEELETEIWDRNFNFSRTIEPTLNGYNFYPVLHLVPYNFGEWTSVSKLYNLNLDSIIIFELFRPNVETYYSSNVSIINFRQFLKSHFNTGLVVTVSIKYERRSGC